MIEAENP